MSSKLLSNSLKQGHKATGFRLICITGTPCTGKSCFANALSELTGYPILTLEDLKKAGLKPAGYDKKRKCDIIDTAKFVKVACRIKKQLEQSGHSGAILDSHMSHFLPKNTVFLCIILHCNLQKLKQRLTKRLYSMEKVRENLDSEIFGICYQEAKELGHKVLELDSSSSTPGILAKQALIALR